MELLRTDARYSSESAGNIAPFGSSEVSLPCHAPNAPSVHEVLSGEEAEMFGRHSRAHFKDRR